MDLLKKLLTLNKEKDKEKKRKLASRCNGKGPYDENTGRSRSKSFSSLTSMDFFFSTIEQGQQDTPNEITETRGSIPCTKENSATYSFKVLCARRLKFKELTTTLVKRISILRCTDDSELIYCGALLRRADVSFIREELVDFIEKFITHQEEIYNASSRQIQESCSCMATPKLNSSRTILQVQQQLSTELLPSENTPLQNSHPNTGKILLEALDVSEHTVQEESLFINCVLLLGFFMNPEKGWMEEVSDDKFTKGSICWTREKLCDIGIHSLIRIFVDTSISLTEASRKTHQGSKRGTILTTEHQSTNERATQRGSANNFCDNQKQIIQGDELNNATKTKKETNEAVPKLDAPSLSNRQKQGLTPDELTSCKGSDTADDILITTKIGQSIKDFHWYWRSVTHLVAEVLTYSAKPSCEPSIPRLGATSKPTRLGRGTTARTLNLGREGRLSSVGMKARGATMSPEAWSTLLSSAEENRLSTKSQEKAENGCLEEPNYRHYKNTIASLNECAGEVINKMLEYYDNAKQVQRNSMDCEGAEKTLSQYLFFIRGIGSLALQQRKLKRTPGVSKNTILDALRRLTARISSTYSSIEKLEGNFSSLKEQKKTNQLQDQKEVIKDIPAPKEQEGEKSDENDKEATQGQICTTYASSIISSILYPINRSTATKKLTCAMNSLVKYAENAEDLALYARLLHICITLLRSSLISEHGSSTKVNQKEMKISKQKINRLTAREQETAAINNFFKQEGDDLLFNSIIATESEMEVKRLLKRKLREETNFKESNTQDHSSEKMSEDFFDTLSLIRETILGIISKKKSNSFTREETEEDYNYLEELQALQENRLISLRKEDRDNQKFKSPLNISDCQTITSTNNSQRTTNLESCDLNTNPTTTSLPLESNIDNKGEKCWKEQGGVFPALLSLTFSLFDHWLEEAKSKEEAEETNNQTSTEAKHKTKTIPSEKGKSNPGKEFAEMNEEAKEKKRDEPHFEILCQYPQQQQLLCSPSFRAQLQKIDRQSVSCSTRNTTKAEVVPNILRLSLPVPGVEKQLEHEGSHGILGVVTSLALRGGESGAQCLIRAVAQASDQSAYRAFIKSGALTVLTRGWRVLGREARALISKLFKFGTAIAEPSKITKTRELCHRHEREALLALLSCAEPQSEENVLEDFKDVLPTAATEEGIVDNNIFTSNADSKNDAQTYGTDPAKDLSDALTIALDYIENGLSQKDTSFIAERNTSDTPCPILNSLFQWLSYRLSTSQYCSILTIGARAIRAIKCNIVGSRLLELSPMINGKIKIIQECIPGANQKKDSDDFDNTISELTKIRDGVINVLLAFCERETQCDAIEVLCKYISSIVDDLHSEIKKHQKDTAPTKEAISDTQQKENTDTVLPRDLRIKVLHENLIAFLTALEKILREEASNNYKTRTLDQMDGTMECSSQPNNSAYGEENTKKNENYDASTETERNISEEYKGQKTAMESNTANDFQFPPFHEAFCTYGGFSSISKVLLLCNHDEYAGLFSSSNTASGFEEESIIVELSLRILVAGTRIGGYTSQSSSGFQTNERATCTLRTPYTFFERDCSSYLVAKILASSALLFTPKKTANSILSPVTITRIPSSHSCTLSVSEDEHDNDKDTSNNLEISCMETSRNDGRSDTSLQIKHTETTDDTSQPPLLSNTIRTRGQMKINEKEESENSSETNITNKEKIANDFAASRDALFLIDLFLAVGQQHLLNDSNILPCGSALCAYRLPTESNPQGEFIRRRSEPTDEVHGGRTHSYLTEDTEERECFMFRTDDYTPRVLSVHNTTSEYIHTHRPLMTAAGPMLALLHALPLFEKSSRTVAYYIAQHCLYAVSVRGSNARSLLCAAGALDLIVSSDLPRALLSSKGSQSESEFASKLEKLFFFDSVSEPIDDQECCETKTIGTINHSRKQSTSEKTKTVITTGHRFETFRVARWNPLLLSSGFSLIEPLSCEYPELLTLYTYHTVATLLVAEDATPTARALLQRNAELSSSPLLAAAARSILGNGVMIGCFDDVPSFTLEWVKHCVNCTSAPKQDEMDHNNEPHNEQKRDTKKNTSVNEATESLHAPFHTRSGKTSYEHQIIPSMLGITIVSLPKDIRSSLSCNIPPKVFPTAEFAFVCWVNIQRFKEKSMADTPQLDWDEPFTVFQASGSVDRKYDISLSMNERIATISTRDCKTQIYFNSPLTPMQWHCIVLAVKRGIISCDYSLLIDGSIAGNGKLQYTANGSSMQPMKLEIGVLGTRMSCEKGDSNTANSDDKTTEMTEKQKPSHTHYRRLLVSYFLLTNRALGTAETLSIYLQGPVYGSAAAAREQRVTEGVARGSNRRLVDGTTLSKLRQRRASTGSDPSTEASSTSRTQFLGAAEYEDSEEDLGTLLPPPFDLADLGHILLLTPQNLTEVCLPFMEQGTEGLPSTCYLVHNAAQRADCSGIVFRATSCNIRRATSLCTAYWGGEGIREVLLLAERATSACQLDLAVGMLSVIARRDWVQEEAALSVHACSRFAALLHAKQPLVTLRTLIHVLEMATAHPTDVHNSTNKVSVKALLNKMQIQAEQQQRRQLAYDTATSSKFMTEKDLNEKGEANTERKQDSMTTTPRDEHEFILDGAWRSVLSDLPLWSGDSVLLATALSSLLQALSTKSCLFNAARLRRAGTVDYTLAALAVEPRRAFRCGVAALAFTLIAELLGTEVPETHSLLRCATSSTFSQSPESSPRMHPLNSPRSNTALLTSKWKASPSLRGRTLGESQALSTALSGAPHLSASPGSPSALQGRKMQDASKTLSTGFLGLFVGSERAGTAQEQTKALLTTPIDPPFSEVLRRQGALLRRVSMPRLLSFALSMHDKHREVFLRSGKKKTQHAALCEAALALMCNIDKIDPPSSLSSTNIVEEMYITGERDPALRDSKRESQIIRPLRAEDFLPLLSASLPQRVAFKALSLILSRALPPVTCSALQSSSLKNQETIDEDTTNEIVSNPTSKQTSIRTSTDSGDSKNVKLTVSEATTIAPLVPPIGPLFPFLQTRQTTTLHGRWKTAENAIWNTLQLALLPHASQAPIHFALLAHLFDISPTELPERFLRKSDENQEERAALFCDYIAERRNTKGLSFPKVAHPEALEIELTLLQHAIAEEEQAQTNEWFGNNELDLDHDQKGNQEIDIGRGAITFKEQSKPKNSTTVLLTLLALTKRSQQFNILLCTPVLFNLLCMCLSARPSDPVAAQILINLIQWICEFDIKQRTAQRTNQQRELQHKSRKSESKDEGFFDTKEEVKSFKQLTKSSAEYLKGLPIPPQSLLCLSLRRLADDFAGHISSVLCTMLLQAIQVIGKNGEAITRVLSGIQCYATTSEDMRCCIAICTALAFAVTDNTLTTEQDDESATIRFLLSILERREQMRKVEKNQLQDLERQEQRIHQQQRRIQELQEQYERAQKNEHQQGHQKDIQLQQLSPQQLQQQQQQCAQQLDQLQKELLLVQQQQQQHLAEQKRPENVALLYCDKYLTELVAFLCILVLARNKAIQKALQEQGLLKTEAENAAAGALCPNGSILMTTRSCTAILSSTSGLRTAIEFLESSVIFNGAGDYWAALSGILLALMISSNVDTCTKQTASEMLRMLCSTRAKEILTSSPTLHDDARAATFCSALVAQPQGMELNWALKNQLVPAPSVAAPFFSCVTRLISGIERVKREYTIFRARRSQSEAALRSTKESLAKEKIDSTKFSFPRFTAAHSVSSCEGLTGVIDNFMSRSLSSGVFFSSGGTEKPSPVILKALDSLLAPLAPIDARYQKWKRDEVETPFGVRKRFARDEDFYRRYPVRRPRALSNAPTRHAQPRSLCREGSVTSTDTNGYLRRAQHSKNSIAIALFSPESVVTPLDATDSLPLANEANEFTDVLPHLSTPSPRLSPLTPMNEQETKSRKERHHLDREGNYRSDVQRKTMRSLTPPPRASEDDPLTVAPSIPDPSSPSATSLEKPQACSTETPLERVCQLSANHFPSLAQSGGSAYALDPLCLDMESLHHPMTFVTGLTTSYEGDQLEVKLGVHANAGEKERGEKEKGETKNEILQKKSLSVIARRRKSNASASRRGVALPPIIVETKATTNSNKGYDERPRQEQTTHTPTNETMSTPTGQTNKPIDPHESSNNASSDHDAATQNLSTSIEAFKQHDAEKQTELPKNDSTASELNLDELLCVTPNERHQRRKPSSTTNNDTSPKKTEHTPLTVSPKHSTIAKDRVITEALSTPPQLPPNKTKSRGGAANDGFVLPGLELASPVGVAGFTLSTPSKTTRSWKAPVRLPRSTSNASPAESDGSPRTTLDTSALTKNASLAAAIGKDVLARRRGEQAKGRLGKSAEQKLYELLGTNEPLVAVYNASQLSGLNESEVLLCFTPTVLYIVPNFKTQSQGLVQSGELKITELAQKRTHMRISSRASNFTVQSGKVIIKHAVKRYVSGEMSRAVRRMYLFQDVGVELYSVGGRSTLLVLDSTTIDPFCDILQQTFPRCAFNKNKAESKLLKAVRTTAGSAAGSPFPFTVSSSSAFSLLFSSALSSTADESGTLLEKHFTSSLDEMTRLWTEGRISNFEYLLFVNMRAGRTTSDLCQYPVFPWILADYSSSAINLSDTKTFRDLTKPMGALNETRLCKAKEMFDLADDDEDGGIGDENGNRILYSRFHWGSHYSSVGVVLYYLLRLEPYSGLARDLQGGRWDHPDRLFHSVREAWEINTGTSSQVMELIPEFFYLPNFLTNSNKFDFGSRQNGTEIGDVELPPWANHDAWEFIRLHAQALESEYVSAHLSDWLDLIFGYKQRGKAAVESTNVFNRFSYAGGVDLEGLTDPLERAAAIDTINNFGQTPKQLWTKPHPRRCVLNPNGTAPLSIALPAAKPTSSNREYYTLTREKSGGSMSSGVRTSRDLDQDAKDRLSIENATGSATIESVSSSRGVQTQESPTISRVPVHESRECRLLRTYEGPVHALAVLGQERVAAFPPGYTCNAAGSSLSFRSPLLSLHTPDRSVCTTALLPSCSVTAAAINNRSDYVVCGCSDGTIHVLRSADVTERKKTSRILVPQPRVRAFQHHLSTISAVAVCTSFATFWTGDVDGNVCVWDTEKLTQTHAMQHTLLSPNQPAVIQTRDKTTQQPERAISPRLTSPLLPPSLSEAKTQPVLISQAQPSGDALNRPQNSTASQSTRTNSQREPLAPPLPPNAVIGIAIHSRSGCAVSATANEIAVWSINGERLSAVGISGTPYGGNETFCTKRETGLSELFEQLSITVYDAASVTCCSAIDDPFNFIAPAGVCTGHSDGTVLVWSLTSPVVPAESCRLILTPLRVFTLAHSPVSCCTASLDFAAWENDCQEGTEDPFNTITASANGDKKGGKIEGGAENDGEKTWDSQWIARAIVGQQNGAVALLTDDAPQLLCHTRKSQVIVTGKPSSNVPENDKMIPAVTFFKEIK